MKYIPTAEKVTVENYPYGFRLKTTLYDTIEFDAKKGYRHVTQTINPKNGVLNKPKKGVYYDLMVRYYDENNHIKTIVFNVVIDGVKGINRLSEFLNANFLLFSSAEINYLCLKTLSAMKVSMYGYVQYSGSKMDDLKPLFQDAIDTMTEQLKDRTLNKFGFILDEEAIESTKVKDYNPFKITSYA